VNRVNRADTEEVRAFRDKRIDIICENRQLLEIPLHEGPKVILHLLPLSSFGPLSISHADNELTALIDNPDMLLPLSKDLFSKYYWGAEKPYIIADQFGYPDETLLNDRSPFAYLLVSGGGRIESVDSGSFIRSEKEGEQRKNILHIEDLETEYLKAVKGRYLEILKYRLHLKPPIYLSMTLTDVKGVTVRGELSSPAGKAMMSGAYFSEDCRQAGVSIDDYEEYGWLLDSVLANLRKCLER